MASPLRKRLTKRAATPDIKGAMSADAVSDTSAGENLMPKRHSHKTSKPMAQDDMSTTPSPPPPERKKAPIHARESERTESPSSKLLFRYKNRIATNHQIMTSSSKLSVATFARTAGRDTTSREPVQVEHPPVTPENTHPPPKYASEPIGVTRVYDGVRFEMMSAQKPSEVSDETTSSKRRRQTRSQTRRQERIDSHMGPLDSHTGKEGHGLTIRKVQDVESTPSPLAYKHEHDVADTGLVTPTSATSTYSPQDQLALSSSTATDSIEASSSFMSLDSDVITSTPKIGSYRKAQQAKPPPIPPMSINPPLFDPRKPPGLQWTSKLGSSSMPSEPWGWLKKWTCCQCGVLDPNGQGNSATTMVEQRVCSRLECGHERCPLGCVVLRE